MTFRHRRTHYYNGRLGELTGHYEFLIIQPPKLYVKRILSHCYRGELNRLTGNPHIYSPDDLICRKERCGNLSSSLPNLLCPKRISARLHTFLAHSQHTVLQIEYQVTARRVLLNDYLLTIRPNSYF